MNKQNRSSEEAKIDVTSLVNQITNVSNVHINVSQECIIITEDKARLCLSEHLKQMERKHGWITPLAILITIILTFVTSKFHDALGLSSATWQAMFIIAGSMVLVWFGFSIKDAIKSKNLEDIIDELKKGSQVKSKHNITGQISDKEKAKFDNFNDWRTTKGPWKIQGEVLELSAPSISPEAYYIWSPTPFLSSINIKFRLEFLEEAPIDFRIAFFAKNPSETYHRSNHFLCLAPWEGGNYRTDSLINGKPTNFTQNPEFISPVCNQPLYYNITLDSKHIIVKIDGKTVLQGSAETISQFSRRPAYWGFSSIGGHFQVSELETEIT